MSLALRAARAYGDARAQARSPRDTEYDALARITARLARASAAPALAQPGGFAALAEALHENRRLWALLAADLAGPGNALPPGLRAQLLGLAGFCLSETSRILSGEGECARLLEINTALMRGLAGQADTATPPPGMSGAQAAGAGA